MDQSGFSKIRVRITVHHFIIIFIFIIHVFILLFIIILFMAFLIFLIIFIVYYCAALTDDSCWVSLCCQGDIIIIINCNQTPSTQFGWRLFGCLRVKLFRVVNNRKHLRRWCWSVKAANKGEKASFHFLQLQLRSLLKSSDRKPNGHMSISPAWNDHFTPLQNTCLLSEDSSAFRHCFIRFQSTAGRINPNVKSAQCFLFTFIYQ